MKSFSKDRFLSGAFDALFPVLYGAAFYTYLAVLERILRGLRFRDSVLCLFFLPIMALELWAAHYFRSAKDPQRIQNAFDAVGFIIRHFFWQFALFYFWIIFPSRPTFIFAWMGPHRPYALKLFWLGLNLRPVASWFVLGLLAIIYYIIWVRHKMGRIFFSIASPLALFVSVVFLFYYNIVGGQRAADFIGQPGVSMVLPFDHDEVAGLKFPRCLQADWRKGRLYLSAGSTVPSPAPSPRLMACDLDGKNLKTFSFSASARRLMDKSNTFREFQMEPHAEDLFISSYFAAYKIYRIDRVGLSVLEEIPFDFLREELKEYSLYDIVPDQAHNRIFFATGQPPAVARIGRAGKTTKVLDLSKLGIAEFGSLVHILRYDKKAQRIVAIAITGIAVPGNKGGLLFEVNPETMNIVRMLPLPGLPMSLELDTKNNEIVLGMALWRAMLVIDRTTFKIKQVISMPTPIIRRFDVDSQSGLLYVVDYVHGQFHIIKKNSGQIVKTYNVGNKPLGMVRYGSTAYVASSLGIIKIELPNPVSLGDGVPHRQKSQGLDSGGRVGERYRGALLPVGDRTLLTHQLSAW